MFFLRCIFPIRGMKGSGTGLIFCCWHDSKQSRPNKSASYQPVRTLQIPSSCKTLLTYGSSKSFRTTEKPLAFPPGSSEEQTDFSLVLNVRIHIQISGQNSGIQTPSLQHTLLMGIELGPAMVGMIQWHKGFASSTNLTLTLDLNAPVRCNLTAREGAVSPMPGAWEWWGQNRKWQCRKTGSHVLFQRTKQTSTRALDKANVCWAPAVCQALCVASARSRIPSLLRANQYVSTWHVYRLAWPKEQANEGPGAKSGLRPIL